MTDVMNQLQQNFNIAGMENVNQSLKVLISKARRELAANKWRQGTAIKQLVGFYNVMDNLNQQWPQMKQLFADNELSPQDQIDLGKLLQSATKDNVFSSLAQAFKLKTPHAQGLDPNSVVQGIMAAAALEGGVDDVGKLFQKAQGLPSVDPQGEPKLQGKPEAPAPGSPPGETAGSVAPEPGDATAGTTGSTPSAKAPTTTQIAQDVVKKASLPAEQAGTYEALMNVLGQHGYQVVSNK